MKKRPLRPDILAVVLACSVAACDEQPLHPMPIEGAHVTGVGMLGAGGGSSEEADGGAAGAGGGAPQPMSVPGIPPASHCPCSRALGRPQMTETLFCPSGSGAKIEATIGPAGGTLSMMTGSEGVTLELDVPAGALSAPTLIAVVELPGPTPTGFTDYSPVYAFEPTGLQFAVPARLRLPWDIVLPRGGEFVTPRELSIYEAASESGDYERLPDSYVNAGFSQASLSTLGYVFAGYPATLDPPDCTAP
jgi:hypothetical protein